MRRGPFKILQSHVIVGIAQRGEKDNFGRTQPTGACNAGSHLQYHWVVTSDVFRRRTGPPAKSQLASLTSCNTTPSTPRRGVESAERTVHTTLFSAKPIIISATPPRICEESKVIMSKMERWNLEETSILEMDEALEEPPTIPLGGRPSWSRMEAGSFLVSRKRCRLPNRA